MEESIAKKSTALVTGASGFIGYHISMKLLQSGWRVLGIDNFNNYYDISLKKDREKLLIKNKCYRSIEGCIETPNLLFSIFKKERPKVVVHLAGQAGVRHSLDNPRSYLESNIIGTFELLEAAKAFHPEHILIASTSSAYGASKNMPYKETSISDHQISFYAATKKSSENIAHSYSYLYQMPITIFRFFTVYGPWGRPDMAYYKFTKKIINGETIDVYNHGKMNRDFTYIDDLSYSILLLISTIPNKLGKKVSVNDSISSVAPFRVVNIGNSNPVKLTDFINAIEKNLGLTAKKNMLEIQIGDVEATWASSSLLKDLIGYCPKTNINEGIKKFIIWYRNYYKI